MAKVFSSIIINPFDLIITYRPNVFTSNGWVYISLGEYLAIIKNDKQLQGIYDEMQANFLKTEGLPQDGYEGGGDYIVYPQHHKEPNKSNYREKKLKLPCVNYFGKFLPPVDDMRINGFGNGVVVLDIDLKGKFISIGITEPQIELAANQLAVHFKAHKSIIFYYGSSSGLGYHIGYLTDANTSEEYKIVYDQLVLELLEDCPVFSGDGIVDNSVGRFNANFFTNHSDAVFDKHPKEIYKGDYTNKIIPTEINLTTINLTPVKEVYKEFPYSIDFRLFLAFKKKNDDEYFNDRSDWMKMMYALITVFPYAYLVRMEYWFVKLSELSPKYNSDDDLDTFMNLVDNNSNKNDTGVDYIINHLNGISAQTPKYTKDDVKHYFEDLDNDDLPDKETSDFLYINKYLIEIKDSLNLEENLIIESPPNTGKSTFFLRDVDFKRIYLVPTKIMIEDLKKHNSNAQVVQEGVLSDEININADLIISTYEGLEKILNSRINFADYTLLIDESHNLFTAASPHFRFLALYRITQNFNKFKNTILLSGTWIEFPFSKTYFRLIKVRTRNPTFTDLEIITTETPLDTLTADIVNNAGKQIVLINNKLENNELKTLLIKNNPAAVVTLMNSETKKSEKVKEILEINHLKPGEILVGTQMIIEGISFLDDDFTAISYYRNMLPEYIAQLSYRVRKSDPKPIIKFYQSGEEFQLRKESDYQYTYNKIKQENLGKDVSLMASKFIGDTTIRVSVEQKKIKTKVVELQVPYIFDHRVDGTPQLNLMLLGYFSLEKISQSLNADIFSLLAHLRKWNFRFSLSTAEKSFVRKLFKEMRAIDQKDLLRNNFSAIADLQYEDISYNKRNPLYVAWLFTQFLNLEYFTTMEPDVREQLFLDIKKYQALADEVMGSILLQGKSMLYVSELLSKNFEILDEPILIKIQSVDGYPDKISNENLAAEFVYLNITLSTIKKVLKKYYVVSESIPLKNRDNKSIRFFSLSPLENRFSENIISEAISNILRQPF